LRLAGKVEAVKCQVNLFKISKHYKQAVTTQRIFSEGIGGLIYQASATGRCSRAYMDVFTRLINQFPMPSVLNSLSSYNKRATKTVKAGYFHGTPARISWKLSARPWLIENVTY